MTELGSCKKCKRKVHPTYIVSKTVDVDGNIVQDVCELCSDEIEDDRILCQTDPGLWWKKRGKNLDKMLEALE